MWFDNDRLSHWFAGAVLSWALFFAFTFLLLHSALKVPIAPIAVFSGIFCAVQLLVTPWLFSARATSQNPNGNRAQAGATVIVWITVATLFFLYWVRHTLIEDIETRRFTAIAIGMTILFCIGGLIRYCLMPTTRQTNADRSTPD